MVSIAQTAFFQRLSETPLQPMVQELVSNNVGSYVEDLSNASNLSLNLLIASKSGDRQKAEEYLKVFSKRQPSKESHWIHDNYVLFGIVTAVAKFNLDPAWIAGVINLSLAGAGKIDRGVRETLKNILAGNCNAKSDYHQVSMVYQFLVKEEQFRDEHVNKVFSELWSKPFPFYEDDFLDLISLKALEVAVLKKTLLNEQQQYYLYNFVPAFDRRANLVATLIAWLVILLLVIGVVMGLLKLNAAEENYPTFIKPLLYLFGASGVGFLGIVGWRKWLTKFIRKFINAFFGFRNFELPEAGTRDNR